MQFDWLWRLYQVFGSTIGWLVGVFGLIYGIRERRRSLVLDRIDSEKEIAILEADERAVVEWKSREEHEIESRFALEMYMARLGADPDHPNQPLDEVPNPGREKQLSLNAERRRKSKIDKLMSEYNQKISHIRTKKEYYQKKGVIVKSK